MKNLITCLVVCVLSGAVAADIINVPGDYASIQDAIDVSNDGDTIMIAGGLYYEYNINPGGKSITLEGATDTGGLPVTTIDAQMQGRVLECNSGETNKTIFENLIITGGFTFHGGGMRNTNASPKIQNCIFTLNEAIEEGAGISNYSSSPVISNCTFTNNSALKSNDSYGAGVYFDGNCNSVLTDCLFADNYAGRGGAGIFCGYGATQISLLDCRFENNESSCEGAVSLVSGTVASLTNCVFTGNTGCQGAALDAWSAHTTLTNCTFTNNAADYYGGAIRMGSGDMELTGCLFSGNTTGSSYEGGALYLWYGTSSLTDCTVVDNVAGEGGGIFLKDNTATITDCMIANNTALDGYAGGVYSDGGSNAVIAGTTICGNTPMQIFGNWTDAGDNEVQTTCGSMEGACCIGEDCVILEQKDCKGSGGEWQGYDVLCEDVSCVQPPAFGACCINGEALALYEFDCDRIQGTFMGAGTNPDDVTCPTHCAEDVNGDGLINVSDLLAIISVWGACP